jgi:uncharacterized membrane protein YkvA (DUF1232 family)
MMCESAEKIGTKLRRRAQALKSETYALYLALQDPRVPLHAKILAAVVVGYAFSPLDLIPDFIPVLGYLDDLILVPAGIALVLRMIPVEVMDDSRAKAVAQVHDGKPLNRVAGATVVLIWLLLAVLSVALVVRCLD